MCCHFLLQGILLTQGLNLCLLHWQVDSLPLNHKEVTYPLIYIYKNFDVAEFFPKVNHIFVVVQSLSRVWLLVTPWIAAHQASLSFTISQSLLILMSIEPMMPSNHLICCSLLLLPLIFSSIGLFSSELALHIRWPNYWSFSTSPSEEGIHRAWTPSQACLCWLCVAASPVDFDLCA